MGCLSRMRGNLHVRFLGEGVAVRPPPYPTDAVSSILIARSRSRRKSQPNRLAFSFLNGRRDLHMTDFLDYQVATVGVAGFPVPVTGLTSGETNGGLYSVFIAPGIALHVAEDEVNQSGFTARQFLEQCSELAAMKVAKSDPSLAATMTLFDLVAALHFCLATKRETEEDARRSIAILLNARKDLLELVRGKTH